MYRMRDGVLMCTATHIKYVAPPVWWPLVASMRVSLLQMAVASQVRDAMDVSEEFSRSANAYDTAIEATTGLSRDEAGKRTYFASYGNGTHPMQGFDSSLEGALQVGPKPAGDTQAWVLHVGKNHLNPFGALHGGCSASLVLNFTILTNFTLTELDRPCQFYPC
jgi:hypothetical protein